MKKLLWLFVPVLFLGCSAAPNAGPKADPEKPEAIDDCNIETCLSYGRSPEKTQDAKYPPIYWFTKGCDLGDEASCNEAGWATYKGLGVPASDVKAVAFYKKSCGGLPIKDPYGCGNLGWHLLTGRGVDIDYVASSAAYVISCDANLAASCFSLGIAYERARGVEKNEVLARKLYTQSCAKDYGKACTNLGVMQLSGIGGSVDLPEAIRHLTLQCEKNSDPWACASLGYAYSNGYGVEKNKCTSKTLYEKSCGIDENPLGCANFGDIIYAGSCGKVDHLRAFELLSNACKHKYAEGCGSLGRMYQLGHGVEAHDAKAKSFYERGCKHDDPYACQLLGKTFERGTLSTKRDNVKALSFYRQSCHTGRKSACEAGLRLSKKIGSAEKNYFQQRSNALSGEKTKAVETP